MSSSYSKLKADDEDGDELLPRGGDSSSIDSSISDNSAYLNAPPSIERGGFFPTAARSGEESDNADYFSSPSESSDSTASHVGEIDLTTTTNSTSNTTSVIPQTITRSGPPLGLDTVFEVDGVVTDGESTAAGKTTNASVAASENTASTSIPGSIATDFNQLSPSAFSDFGVHSPTGTSASATGTGSGLGEQNAGIDNILIFDNKKQDADSSTVATPDSAIAFLVQGSAATTNEQDEGSVHSIPSRSASLSTSSRTNTPSTSPEGGDMFAPSKSPRSLLFGQFDVPDTFDPIIRISSSSTFVFLVANDHWSSPASRVILKLMNDPKQVAAELLGRKGIDEKFLLACRGVFLDSESAELDCHGPLRCERHENLATEMQELIESRIKRTSKATDVQVRIPSFPYMLAFERYDCTLQEVLDHSYLDLSIVRSIIKDVVIGLILLHTEKRIHGNINPTSIVRVKKSWKLADLHAARAIEQYIDLKSVNQSSLPPEAAASILNSEDASPKCVADTPYDLFSLGCVLYHLVFGKPLWNVNNTGTISRGEMKKLAQWTPRTIFEQVSTRFLENWRSEEQMAVLDLMNKLLARTSAERSEFFSYGAVSVHQHEFLSRKPLEAESMKEFAATNDAVIRDEENFQRYQDIIKELTMEERWELKRAKDVLLLGLFEPSSVQIPTSIVVLRRKLPTQKPEEMTKREAQKRLAEGIKWIDVFDNLMLSVRGSLEGDVSSIGHFWIEISGFFKGDNMFMYFIDELTGEPIVLLEGESTSYPIEITTRSDGLPTILPMMHLTMRSMALYHGVAGIARMFGCSLSALPEDMRTKAQEKINALKKERNLYPFGSIADDVSAVDANKEQFMRSNSLRAKSVAALTKLLEKRLGHEALATGSFAGLHRYPDEDGRAFYTLLADVDSVKHAIQTRGDERLKEERNLWLDRNQEKINALESALAEEKESSVQLKARLETRLVEMEQEIQRRNEAAQFLESNLMETQKSLDETNKEVERTKQELEIEMQKPKCGSDACIVQ